MKAVLPKSVFEKHGAYYYVTSDGEKRKWRKLSRIKCGMPALYLAMAALNSGDVKDDSMANVIDLWMVEMSINHAKKTQDNEVYMSREIKRSFTEFHASQIRTSHVLQFLRAFKEMPRSYNAYRSHFQELMRFAETKDFREPGSNPVTSIKPMRTAVRKRYITDSELRRIKIAAIYYQRKTMEKVQPVKGMKAPVKVASFEQVAQELFENSKANWQPRYANWWITRMKNYIFPTIGTLPVSAVTTQSLPEVMMRKDNPSIPAAIRNSLDHMSLKTESRTRSMVTQVLRYAIQTGRSDVAVANRTIKTRIASGLMLAMLLEMAYLSGQRVGDLLSMEWREVQRDGILFQPSKVANSTGAKVLIQWTPRLRALVDRLQSQNRLNLRWVFTNKNGQKLTYSAIYNQWAKAVERAGIRDVHFHDLKGKALTDVDEERGIIDAQGMGGHSTQSQTADYIRNIKPKKVRATK